MTKFKELIWVKEKDVLVDTFTSTSTILYDHKITFKIVVGKEIKLMDYIDNLSIYVNSVEEGKRKAQIQFEKYCNEILSNISMYYDTAPKIEADNDISYIGKDIRRWCRENSSKEQSAKEIYNKYYAEGYTPNDEVYYFLEYVSLRDSYKECGSSKMYGYRLVRDIEKSPKEGTNYGNNRVQNKNRIGR